MEYLYFWSVITLVAMAIALLGVRVGLAIADRREKRRRKRVVQNLEKQDIERKSHE